MFLYTHYNVGYAYDLFFLDRIIMMELPHKTLKWLLCNISILCFCTPTAMWDMLRLIFLGKNHHDGVAAQNPKMVAMQYIHFIFLYTHYNAGYAYDLFFLDRIIMMELPHKTLKWLPCNISILYFCTPNTMRKCL